MCFGDKTRHPSVGSGDSPSIAGIKNAQLMARKISTGRPGCICHQNGSWIAAGYDLLSTRLDQITDTPYALTKIKRVFYNMR